MEARLFRAAKQSMSVAFMWQKTNSGSMLPASTMPSATATLLPGGRRVDHKRRRRRFDSVLPKPIAGED